VEIKELGATVWKILSGMPIEVFDEEQYSVWENDLWELVKPRPDGDFSGSRSIGSANMIAAFNIIHQSMLINQIREQHSVDSTTRSLELFKNILDYLRQEKLIRKKPHKLRQTFQVV
jgi:hypothetical protein